MLFALLGGSISFLAETQSILRHLFANFICIDNTAMEKYWVY